MYYNCLFTFYPRKYERSSINSMECSDAAIMDVVVSVVCCLQLFFIHVRDFFDVFTFDDLCSVCTQVWIFEFASMFELTCDLSLFLDIPHSGYEASSLLPFLKLWSHCFSFIYYCLYNTNAVSYNTYHLCISAGTCSRMACSGDVMFLLCPVVCRVTTQTHPQGWRVHYTHTATKASDDCGRSAIL